MGGDRGRRAARERARPKGIAALWAAALSSSRTRCAVAATREPASSARRGARWAMRGAPRRDLRAPGFSPGPATVAEEAGETAALAAGVLVAVQQKVKAHTTNCQWRHI